MTMPMGDLSGSKTSPEDSGARSQMPPPADRKSAGPQDKAAANNGTPVKTKEKDINGCGTVDSGKKPSKRRKVNHACVYCRRSHMTCDLERPCARCIKRDIGHLCHDEPREPPKRNKSEADLAPTESNKPDPATFDNFASNDSNVNILSADTAESGELAEIKPLSPLASQRPANTGAGTDMMQGMNQWDFGLQNQFSDLSQLHPYNTFGTSEVNNEYNLLGDFLSSSLLDDGYKPDDSQALFGDPMLGSNTMREFAALGMHQQSTQPQTALNKAGNEISRPSSTFPVDPKAREKFFLTAADPAGNDPPEERMNKLLKAKYDAGMLKPFNYVKGYARLNGYMEKNMRSVSRQKILRQLNQFRPKFREAMHGLTDIQLVKVEMWFERCLMEYDRVFASMAIPACCWRRTGEIYRGNKEMAELIHVPMENLRDGKIALHEIMVEDSLVSYWEKFGAIAFDQSQKAILTTCSLKNPDPTSKDPFLRCCFSFTIRRDTHNIPAMIVVFTQKLQKHLGTTPIDQPLLSQIRSALGDLTSFPSTPKVAKAADFERFGIELWNTVTHLQADKHGNSNKVTPLVRAFALGLLAIAHKAVPRKSSRRYESTVRLLRLSLRSSKLCIDTSDYDIATTILQSAADYVTALTDSQSHPQNVSSRQPVASTSQDLITEYWTTRALLCWKQERFDLVDVHLQNIKADGEVSLESIEMLVDLLFEIGNDQLGRKNGGEAVKWLTKATAVLDQVDADRITQEMLELRSATLSRLIRGLLLERTEECLRRAADVLSVLEQETVGPKLGVLLLKIQVLEARQSLQPADYQRVLAQIIGTIVLTPTTFKTVLQHIRKLHDLDAALAQQSLELFVTGRLYEHAEQSLIEKAVVFRVWSATQQSIRESQAASLATFLQDVNESTTFSFTAEATHAAQALVWKSIETAYGVQKFELACSWCALARHPIFSAASEVNQSRIARKQMVVSLALGRTAAAREAFYQMPRSGQEAASSRYLLYRVGIRDGDEALLSECLAKLVCAPESESHLLYACVQEAHDHGDKRQALAVLKEVIRKSGANVPRAVHLPALLRVTVQLMIGEIESDSSPDLDALAQVLQAIDAGVNHFRKPDVQETTDAGTTLELQWFAKTSYNIALRWLDCKDADTILGLLRCSYSFTDLLSASLPSDQTEDLTRRQALCHYLSASINIILARSEDEIHASDQHYLSVLSHAVACAELAAKFSSVLDSAKQAQIQQYRIEALLKLRRWEELNVAFESCLDATEADNLDILADLIITAHTIMTQESVDAKYLQAIPRVMQSIINLSWRREKHDMLRLARWLRCVFRMTLTSSPDTALKIVQQAETLASRSSSLIMQQENRRYPPTELEWLASTAFNNAVDRFCASDLEGCRTWAEAGLNLAQVATECPGLYSTMQGLWAKLQERMRP